MTTRKSILVGTAVVPAAGLGYLFRPDALVISKPVNEPLPAAEHSMSARPESPGMTKSESAMAEAPAMAPSAMAAEEPVKLAGGRFHTNAHETHGLAQLYRLPTGRLCRRLPKFAPHTAPPRPVS